MGEPMGSAPAAAPPPTPDGGAAAAAVAGGRSSMITPPALSAFLALAPSERSKRVVGYSNTLARTLLMLFYVLALAEHR